MRHPARFVHEVRELGRQLIAQPGDIHLQGGKVLPELVVDFPRDAGAFLFTGGLKMGGKISEPSVRTLQLFFGPPPLRDVFVGYHDTPLFEPVSDPGGAHPAKYVFAVLAPAGKFIDKRTLALEGGVEISGDLFRLLLVAVEQGDALADEFFRVPAERVPYGVVREDDPSLVQSHDRLWNGIENGRFQGSQLQEPLFRDLLFHGIQRIAESILLVVKDHRRYFFHHPLRSFPASVRCMSCWLSAPFLQC